jgi:hypothetical protein
MRMIAVEASEEASPEMNDRSIFNASTGNLRRYRADRPGLVDDRRVGLDHPDHVRTMLDERLQPPLAVAMCTPLDLGAHATTTQHRETAQERP